MCLRQGLNLSELDAQFPHKVIKLLTATDVAEEEIRG